MAESTSKMCYLNVEASREMLEWFFLLICLKIEISTRSQTYKKNPEKRIIEMFEIM